ncbi:MAG: MBL fold metallo-hydrolase [Planctomycetota bacterium]
MKRTRIATAALVTRGTGHDVEALVVRRAPQLRFFGGFWAFPGGVVDAADHDGDPDADDAHRRCALRELLEEVGLVTPELQGAASLRSALLERDDAPASRRFREVVERNPAALARVAPFARLTTPPFAPVLYRTRFVHLTAPEGFEPDIVEGELVDGAFFAPEELLASWRRGERYVAPPVVFLLEQLAERGLEEFLDEVPAVAGRLEAGALHPIRVVPGIVMAPLETATLPPATTTNAFLVGVDRTWIVDPAPTDTGEQQRLFDLVDARRRDGAYPVGVLLTHHHPDHVGAAEATARRYDVPVLAHAETLSRLDLDVENHRALEDGTVLPLGETPDGKPGWTLTALHTPGHAPGHLAFRESRYGAVLGGDLVSTVSTIVIDPPEGHLATYLASLRALRETMADGGVLHPSHGTVATDGARILDQYLAHRAERERALEAALRGGAALEDDLLREVYEEVDERLLPVAARSLRAGLEKLAEERRATEVQPGHWVPAG